MTVLEMFPDAAPPDGLPSVTVADRARISYKMLDYWLRVGYVDCAHNPAGGSGVPRVWTHLEAAHVYRMAALVRGGFTPHAACDIALDLAETGSARLGHGLTLLEAGT